MANANSDLKFLRHVTATIAYRGGKVVRDAPAGLAELRVSDTSRTSLEILAHIGDVLDWAVSIATGNEIWHDSKAKTWDEQVARFFDSLGRLDEVLSADTVACPAEPLFQGPLADTLTHIGQIAMLRRLVESPVRGENYFKADIKAGRVGATQAKPAREFE